MNKGKAYWKYILDRRMVRLSYFLAHSTIIPAVVIKTEQQLVRKAIRRVNMARK